MVAFEGFCYGFTLKDEVGSPILINENHTIKDIARSLKEDMGLDYDEWLKHDYLDRGFWVDHYKHWAEFWKKQENEGIRQLARALVPLIDKSVDEVENMLTGKVDDAKVLDRARLLRKICNYSYALMLCGLGFAAIAITMGFVI